MKCRPLALPVKRVRRAEIHQDDFHLAQGCLEGNEKALARLQADHSKKVIAFLLKAGALPHEAHEVADSLWGDLVTLGRDGRPRLARYNGMCALQTWLNTVALNFLLTRKRTDRRRTDLFPSASYVETDGSATVAAPEPMIAETVEIPLLTLMRDAIEHAFQECPPEHFVLLQLEHFGNLEREELAQMFACSKATISRRLDEASKAISEATFRYVHTQDEWLDLKWADFLELCRVATPACFAPTD